MSLELSTGPAIAAPKVESVDLPDGVGVATDNGLYLVSKGKRFKALNHKTFFSWDLPTFYFEESQVAHIPVAGGLGFRDGTFIEGMDGRRYVISNSKKRLITTPDLQWINGSPLNFIKASDKEVDFHKDGDPLE